MARSDYINRQNSSFLGKSSRVPKPLWMLSIEILEQNVIKGCSSHYKRNNPTNSLQTDCFTFVVGSFSQADG